MADTGKKVDLQAMLLELTTRLMGKVAYDVRLWLTAKDVIEIVTDCRLCLDGYAGILAVL